MEKVKKKTVILCVSLHVSCVGNKNVKIGKGKAIPVTGREGS
jgi:hypothetical protein